MNYFNKLYLSKNIKLIFGLYGVLTAIIVLDAVLARQGLSIILQRFLYLLPFSILCLGLCFIGVNKFNRSVREEEKRLSVSFSDNNMQKIDSANLIFANSEWIVVAGKYAIHYLDIAEMADPSSYPALRAGGKNDMLSFETKKGKKLRIRGDNLAKLGMVKSAWLNATKEK